MTHAGDVLLALADLPGLAWIGRSPLDRTGFSPAWLMLRDRSLDDECGIRWMGAIHPEDQHRCHAVLAQATRDPVSYEIDYRLATGDGGYRQLRECARPLWREGVLLFLGLCTDITAVAQEARAGREGPLEADFLGAASHELRSPLSAVMAWSRVLEQTLGSGDEATLRRAVDGIRRGTQRQASLLADFSDASSLIAGTLRLYLSTTSLASALAGAVSDHCAAADAKRVSIETHLEGTSPSVRADPERLRQMVSHLVSLAVKCTAVGGRVETRIRAVSGPHGVLEVRYQGRGFSPEGLARALAGRGGTGVGIGLLFVRRLAELHGGLLEAQSDGETLGARFVLKLPPAQGFGAQG